MKKLFLMLILGGIAATGFAGVKRIGYWGTPVSGLDYSTPALAVAACSAGDSIYVYGSTNGSPWTFDLDKRIVIIGTGYYYASNTPSNTNFNPNLQNYSAYSYANINLGDGTSGSIITGIYGRVVVNQSHTSPINNIRVSNIYWTGITSAFKNGMTYDNWEISKCYFQSYSFNYPPGNTAVLTNFKFFNNILNSSELYFGPAAGQSGIIENCTFYSYVGYTTNNWSGANLLVQNCIFTNGPQLNGYNNVVFNNCLFDYTPNPVIVGANNMFNVNYANLYIGIPTQGTYSDDGRWALKPGSPAIGAGINNVDCGAFGGVNPYKLSGIPAVPAFYKLTAPGTAANTNPYTITFSVRANN